MQKFEYMVVPLDDARKIKKNSSGMAPDRLNELGSQGWEAVGLSLKQGDLVAWPVVLLKRPSEKLVPGVQWSTANHGSRCSPVPMRWAMLPRIISG